MSWGSIDSTWLCSFANLSLLPKVLSLKLIHWSSWCIECEIAQLALPKLAELLLALSSPLFTLKRRGHKKIIITFKFMYNRQTDRQKPAYERYKNFSLSHILWGKTLAPLANDVQYYKWYLHIASQLNLVVQHLKLVPRIYTQVFSSFNPMYLIPQEWMNNQLTATNFCRHTCTCTCLTGSYVSAAKILHKRTISNKTTMMYMQRVSLL